MKKAQGLTLGMVINGFIFIILAIVVVIMLINFNKELTVVPVVMKCPVIDCPVLSEIDCTVEVLDMLNNANAFEQTVKRIG